MAKTKTIILVGLIVMVNIIIYKNDVLWDLTSDQKYSLSEEAQTIIKDLPDGISVTVLLEGNVPTSFKNYRGYIDNYLGELRRNNKNIQFNYKDPTKGSASEVIDFKRYLQSYGVTPISRRVTKEEGLSQSVIYPYISVQNADRVVFVNLLEAKQANQSEEEAILNSQIQLEAKLIKAFRDVSQGTSGLVAIVGNQNITLAKALNEERGKMGNYFYLPMNGPQSLSQLDTLDFVIAILKDKDLKRSEKMAIDQALMQDVPVLWLVDKYSVGVDSIGKYKEFVALAQQFGTEDMLFKYGVRLSSDLIQDSECSPIVQVVGEEGGQPQTALIPFPYHPLIKINAGIFSTISDPINFKFITSLDTIKRKLKTNYEVLLQTSPYTRLMTSPVTLNFKFLRVMADPKDYNAKEQSIAISIFGEQNSYFENRLKQEDKDLLKSVQQEFKNSTTMARQIVISDVDFALPDMAPNGSYYPIGYNFWDRQMYQGNKVFLASIFEFLIHGDNLIRLNKQQINTSLIDKRKFDDHANWFYFLLIGLPSILTILIVISVRYYRKMMYAKA